MEKARKNLEKMFEEINKEDTDIKK